MQSRFFTWLTVESDENGLTDPQALRDCLARIIRDIRRERCESRKAMAMLFARYPISADCACNLTECGQTA
jgi:hypothetical protein